MEMMRMLANSEFRSAAKRVAAELKKAGVDLNSEVRASTLDLKIYNRIQCSLCFQETLQELMRMQKENSGRDK
jgi:hypothetical protein